MAICLPESWRVWGYGMGDLKTRAGPGPGRFPTFYLRLPAILLAQIGPNKDLSALQRRGFACGAAGKHIGVSHLRVGPPKRHI